MIKYNTHEMCIKLDRFNPSTCRSTQVGDEAPLLRA